MDHTEPKEALSDLNDLVIRRNEVAHGEVPGELLNHRVLLDYIRLLEVYGEALYEVVYSEVLKYEVKYNGTELGSPIKIYKQGNIIGISVKDTTIRVRDLLVAKTRIPSAMRIKELKLTNFRCFESLSIEMDEQLTVLIAPNGAGKTALLDAIALGLGPFVSKFPDISGIRPSKDKDLHIRDDGTRAPYMRIGLKLTDGVAWGRTVKRDSTEKTRRQIPQGSGLVQLHRYADRFIYVPEEDAKPPILPIIAYYRLLRHWAGRVWHLEGASEKKIPAI